MFYECPINKAEDIPQAIRLAKDCLRVLPDTMRIHSGTNTFYCAGGTGKAAISLIYKDPGISAEGKILSRSTVMRKLEETASAPREKRTAIPGFPPSRIDILPAGLVILAAVMDFLSVGYVTVTERCNTDGLLRILSYKTAS